MRLSITGYILFQADTDCSYSLFDKTTPLHFGYHLYNGRSLLDGMLETCEKRTNQTNNDPETKWHDIETRQTCEIYDAENEEINDRGGS